MNAKENLSKFSQSVWMTVGVFLVFALVFTFYVRSEKRIDDMNDLRLKGHLLSNELRQSSNDLSNMAHSYVITGNPIYKQSYQKILDIHEGKARRPIEYHNIYWELVLSNEQKLHSDSTQSIALLDLMKQSGLTKEEYVKLAEAKKSFNVLTRIEIEAMRLMDSTTPRSEANFRQASNMLHNKDYSQAKAAMVHPLSELHELMDKRIMEAIETAKLIATLLRITVILVGILLLYMVWRINRKLYLTLGGGVDELHAHIARIGRGDFNSPVVANGMKNSVLGWLWVTQMKLKQIDAKRKEAELALHNSESNLNRAQSVAHIGSWTLDIQSSRLEWSEETYRMFHISQQQAVDLEIFANIVHPDDREMVLKAWNDTLDDAKISLYDIEHRTLIGGEMRWVRERAKIERDSEGNAIVGIGTVQDITEQKQAQEHIQFLANYDPLTGLANRMQLEERAKFALSFVQRNHGSLALMFIDLDHFKDINDTLGHSVGDTLLIEVAKHLKSVIRDEDTLSRFGGDEFIVLLPGIDGSGAEQVAQKLRAIIAKPFLIGPYELSITASIGIALYPEDGANLETLSQSADSAMYRAKEDGRDNYRFFMEEMQERLARNLQLNNALHHALERSQLYIHYQPQVRVRDGHIIGVEALIRWQHPELGFVSPAEFIPIAEENGLILSIGEWVLRTAIRQAKSWIEGGWPPLVMAVNLSAVQFRHSGIADLITDILNEVGLPPEYLEVELTEGVAMHDPQSVITVMNNLHERGIRMSIDDFGTGYSSLSYLKKFKVYKLKIDQSFVRDISTDSEDKAIVGAIINMAHSLGLKTIAEGVETAEQLDYLRDQRCDEIQGYYFSRPVDAATIVSYLQNSAFEATVPIDQIDDI